MTYNGPERRRTPSISLVPLGHFVLALVVTAGFVAALFLLSFSETGQATSKLSKIEAQQRVANDTAENARVVADFIRDCIFYAEQGHCPVKNLQIIKEDNPTGNPKPTTTTTTHG